MKKWSLALIALLILISFSPVSAQDQTGGKAEYIVQPGDTLNAIALKFGVAAQDIIDANGITNPNQLSTGERLVIPGLQGVNGLLSTRVVSFGENLNGISRKFHASLDLLIRLNHITSPAELYAGSTLVLPQPNENSLPAAYTVLKDGESELENALINGTDIWSLRLQNDLPGSAPLIPGEQYFFFPPKNHTPVNEVLPGIKEVKVSPLPLVQGKTTSIEITTSQSLQLEGKLLDSTLNFTNPEPNKYVALQGNQAMTPQGIYPFYLKTTFPDGKSLVTEQMVLLVLGNYPRDPPLTGLPPETLDPVVTKPEDDLITKITTPFTSEKYWKGKFQPPVDEPICIKSWFGDRRSYNGSDFIYYHTGIDFGVCANLNIYAPAPGKVVYTGELTVRGNATIIDHGQGVYSGLYHQKEIKVKVGDMVTAGQLIGIIGATGRVNGPHLHWDLFVNGIQVDPQDWLNNNYP